MTDLQHQPDAGRFCIDVNQLQAVLAYRLFTGPHGPAIDFYSTFVPDPLRGQGLAEKLVRAGLAWAKSQGYEVHASCWYVAKFIR
jgi:uncharacterized protein